MKGSLIMRKRITTSLSVFFVISLLVVMMQVSSSSSAENREIAIAFTGDIQGAVLPGG